MNHSRPDSKAPPTDGPSPTARSVASLLIFIHLFCALSALLAGQTPSGPNDGALLVQRLGRALRFYGQTFQFQTYARYHLTHASSDDVDHRIEYLTPGADAADPANWRILTTGVRGSDRYARNQRLADILAYFADRQDEDSTALLAASVGRHIRNQMGVAAEQLRVRKHLLMEPENLSSVNAARSDPNDPSMFREVYRAQILDFGKGDIRVQKIEERGQVAPAARGRN